MPISMSFDVWPTSLAWTTLIRNTSLPCNISTSKGNLLKISVWFVDSFLLGNVDALTVQARKGGLLGRFSWSLWI